MFATDIRGKTAMSRLSKRRGKIGWHSISCICDDCLDADVYVTCFPHYLAGRLSLEGLTNEAHHDYR